MAYTGPMPEWMIWKALALVFAAFCWGVYCGFTGRPLNGQQPGPERRDRKEPR